MYVDGKTKIAHVGYHITKLPRLNPEMLPACETLELVHFSTWFIVFTNVYFSKYTDISIYKKKKSIFICNFYLFRTVHEVL